MANLGVACQRGSLRQVTHKNYCWPSQACPLLWSQSAGQQGRTFRRNSLADVGTGTSACSCRLQLFCYLFLGLCCSTYILCFYFSQNFYSNSKLEDTLRTASKWVKQEAFPSLLIMSFIWCEIKQFSKKQLTFQECRITVFLYFRRSASHCYFSQRKLLTTNWSQINVLISLCLVALGLYK